MLTNRRIWNKRKISELANDAKPLEIAFGNQLKQWLSHDSNITIEPHTNKFNRHDLVVHHKDFPDSPLFIELECGKDQVQWKTRVQDNREKWVMGLNVLSRKISEGKHFHIFIKHNVACNSFFACTFEYAAQVGKVRYLRKHSLNFNTDSVVYSIPWQETETPNLEEFCMDDATKLREMMLLTWNKTIKNASK